MDSDVTTAQKLGYPPDARLLIVNADDFGMCHDENEATIEGLSAGLFTSSTILTTCPWFEEAAEFARNRPAADLGVHLTLTSEWARYKWGPVLGSKAVASLVDERGYLWPDVPEVFANDRLDEAEAELRAQIEKALAAGIDVTHLDSHMGPLHLRADYHEIYLRLATEYRLPIRLTRRSAMRRMGFGEILSELDRRGILYPDNFYVGGPENPADTGAYWTSLLRELKPGIAEIYCHPALARDELRSCARDAEQREADFRFFTSEQTRRLLADEGIELIGYKRLRAAMRS
ncbi:MAG: polysaccharide deacetylase family protein [Candidatus Binatales bacterium]